jgi:hypothetical protein
MISPRLAKEMLSEHRHVFGGINAGRLRSNAVTAEVDSGEGNFTGFLTKQKLHQQP